MKFMISIVGAMLFTCLIISCSPVTSMAPLSPPDAAELDKRLTGVWLVANEDERLEFHVMDVEKDGWTLGVVVEYLEDDPVLTGFIPFMVHSTVIGDHHYINFNLFEFDDCSGQRCFKESERYHIVKYEISQDRLKIWLMKSRGIKKAIKSGEIEGTVDEDHGLIITDTAKNIAIFLQKTDHDEIFEELILHRMSEISPHDTATDIYQPPF